LTTSPVTAMPGSVIFDGEPYFSWYRDVYNASDSNLVQLIDSLPPESESLMVGTVLDRDVSDYESHKALAPGTLFLCLAACTAHVGQKGWPHKARYVCHESGLIGVIELETDNSNNPGGGEAHQTCDGLPGAEPPPIEGPTQPGDGVRGTTTTEVSVHFDGGGGTTIANTCDGPILVRRPSELP